MPHACARSLRVQRLCLSGRHVSRELIRGQFRGRRRKKSPKAKEIFPDRRCSDICTNQSRKLDTLTTRCRGGPLPLASSDRLVEEPATNGERTNANGRQTYYSRVNCFVETKLAASSSPRPATAAATQNVHSLPRRKGFSQPLTKSVKSTHVIRQCSQSSG